MLEERNAQLAQGQGKQTAGNPAALQVPPLPSARAPPRPHLR